MKQSLFRLTLLFNIVVFSIALVSCEEENSASESDLVGIWTIDKVEAKITVGGVDIVQFLKTTYQLSQDDAESMVDLFANVIESEYTGTLTMNIDSTYAVNLVGEDEETGTWSLSNDGKILTLISNEVGEDISELIVVSVNSEKLVLKLEPEEEDVDLDDDGQDETTLEITVELTLSK